MKKIMLAGAAIAILAAAGCSNQLNDLGGVAQAKPDYAMTYLNVDAFPNITMLCIRGIGFATDTRNYSPVLRIPEWDAFCATKIRP